MTRETIIAEMRKDISKGKRIFTPIWTHCCGRVETTQAIRILHKAGEIMRDPDGSAHWIGAKPALKIFG